MDLPFFKYHPNPLATRAFTQAQYAVVCDCCGCSTHIYYDGPFYAIDDINYLCPNCIASGAAAKKFDGAFQDDGCLETEVLDAEKVDELIHRTVPKKLFKVTHPFWTYPHSVDGIGG